MNYLTLSILISFGSVLGLTALGTAFTKRNIKRTILWASIISVVYSAILYWIYWGNYTGFIAPTPFFGGITIGAILASCISFISEIKKRAAMPAATVAIILAGFSLLLNISSTDFWNADKKATLAVVEKVSKANEAIEPSDVTHICLVSQSMAIVKANEALSKFVIEGGAIAGSRFDIGSPTKQFVDGQFWWIFPLDFKGYFQWKEHPEVPGYLRVSAENPEAEAQPVQQNKQGKSIAIKYMNSACFEFLAERHLRYNGYLMANLDDWTFEVDDDWNPYYTVSEIKRTIGYEGNIVQSVVILDLQTGNIVENCPIADVAKKYHWIDRAYPLDVIKDQLTSWGEYSKVGWRWTSSEDGLRMKPTESWYITYNKDHCQWFTGWTSNNSDAALIGVSLTDAQTGKTIFMNAKGVTESIAYDAAKSLWSNFTGYVPEELVPYNIYGILTYVMPMSYQGQFVGVSLVSVENKDIKAKGTTIEEALSAYRISIGGSHNDREAPSGGEIKRLKLTGIVSEVGILLMQGQQQIIPFRIQGVEKIFNTVYSFSSPKVSFLKPGVEVEITFAETKERIITCETFDIPALKLSEENPKQAQWYQNQKTVKAEDTRIDNIQKNSTIIESSDMSKISPDSLKAFIKKQKEQKK